MVRCSDVDYDAVDVDHPILHVTVSFVCSVHEKLSEAYLVVIVAASRVLSAVPGGARSDRVAVARGEDVHKSKDSVYAVVVSQLREQSNQLHSRLEHRDRVLTTF